MEACFSVKSCYSLLERLRVNEMVIGEGDKRVFNYIWKSPAPLKVLLDSPSRPYFDSVNLALEGVGWRGGGAALYPLWQDGRVGNPSFYSL